MDKIEEETLKEFFEARKKDLLLGLLLSPLILLDMGLAWLDSKLHKRTSTNMRNDDETSN